MTSPTLTLRPAGPEDSQALETLAALDSSPALHGPVLLAESDGRALAAVELVGGRVVADPFAATSEATELLRRRAAQLRPLRARRPLRLTSLGTWATT